MEKTRKHKVICEDCKGNGYIRIEKKSPSKDIFMQCQVCDSEGEVSVSEPTADELNFILTTRLQ